MGVSQLTKLPLLTGGVELVMALSAVQGQLQAIAKTGSAEVHGRSKNGRPVKFGYSYAEYPTVLKAALPLLASQGLALFHQTLPLASGATVLRSMLAHRSGEFVASEMVLRVDQPGNPQRWGSWLTYSKRYATLQLLGMAAGGDDDASSYVQSQGSQGSRSQGAPRQSSRPQSQQQQQQQAQRPQRSGGVYTSEQLRGQLCGLFEGVSADEVEELYRRSKGALSSATRGQLSQEISYLREHPSEVRAGVEEVLSWRASAPIADEQMSRSASPKSAHATGEQPSRCGALKGSRSPAEHATRGDADLRPIQAATPPSTPEESLRAFQERHRAEQPQPELLGPTTQPPQPPQMTEKRRWTLAQKALVKLYPELDVVGVRDLYDLRGIDLGGSSAEDLEREVIDLESRADAREEVQSRLAEYERMRLIERHVTSSDGSTTYTVRRRGGRWSCTCRAGQWRRECKHIKQIKAETETATAGAEPQRRE